MILSTSTLCLPEWDDNRDGHKFWIFIGLPVPKPFSDMFDNESFSESMI